MTEQRLDVDGRKYTFVLPAKDYRVHVLRHGEPWLVIEQGCNAIWSLVSEAIDMRKLVNAVRRWTTSGQNGFMHGELHEAFRVYCAERGDEPPAPRTDAPAEVPEAEPTRLLAVVVAAKAYVTAPPAGGNDEEQWDPQRVACEAFEAFEAYDGTKARDDEPAPSEWRTDDPPRGVRCLVTVHAAGGSRVVVASTSPDHNDARWFSDGHPLFGVIAWMPAPGPAHAPISKDPF